MWYVWNSKRCWAARWSSARDLKWVPYWCHLDRKSIALNGRCQLLLYRVAFLVFFWVFGIVLFLTNGVADDGLGVLTSFCTLWGGVDCETGTLWDGEGCETGGTGTLWGCTGREICGRVGVGVTTGRTIVFFFVDLPRSSAILKSVFLVMSPYSGYSITGGVLWSMARISVADWWI